MCLLCDCGQPLTQVRTQQNLWFFVLFPSSLSLFLTFSSRLCGLISCRFIKRFGKAHFELKLNLFQHDGVIDNFSLSTDFVITRLLKSSCWPFLVCCLLNALMLHIHVHFILKLVRCGKSKTLGYIVCSSVSFLRTAVIVFLLFGLLIFVFS